MEQETTNSTVSSGTKVTEVTFHGQGSDLFEIHLFNILLNIVTLGIYSFWGKTRLRSYVISQTSFGEDRFAYHGTGKELFIGFLKGIALFVALFALFILG